MERDFHQINDPAEIDDGRELEPIEEELADALALQMANEELDMERDRRTSGSFAESQARLSRALDLLTSRITPHLEKR
jgi:hypothetical protein